MNSDENLADKKTNRRSFLIKLLLGSSGIVGILVSIPVVGALLAPLFRYTPRKWRTVGKISDFQSGKTVLVKFRNSDPLPWSGETSKTASWLRKISDNEFIAFSVNCTHLGCPVRWQEDAEIFLCPCHGGVYNKDGSHAAGPPPLGLAQYKVRVEDNKVEILASPIPITTLFEKKRV
jgi:menaquinol-cytochrome c reductase iron-sulfur subunit